MTSYHENKHQTLSDTIIEEEMKILKGEKYKNKLKKRINKQLQLIKAS